MTEEELVQGVCACVGRVVDLDPQDIRVEHRIIEELGADSLDLLDLIFQLEQQFKIRIKTRDIEQRAQAELGDVPLTVNGQYTPEALVRLREAFPEVPAEELPDGLRAVDLPYRFRVATFVRLVKRLLREAHG